MKNSALNNPCKSAPSISLSRGRGRPKSNRPQIDTGTPETVMKRLLGVTTEALDLCLERGIINKTQHWCGIHLRWLYTLRHGVPSVRATDLSYIGGCEQKSEDSEDPLWREAREKEYNEAIILLAQNGHANSLINLCIYNERPSFLNFISSSSSDNLHKNSLEITKNIEKLRDGMDILAKLWKHN